MSEEFRSSCVYCGKPLPEGAIVCTDPFVYTMCKQCHSHSGTCVLCVEANICPFETDPCELPKQVQKTIRQGNAVMQTIVQNPDRIRETCQKSCKCWSDDFGCLKQNGTCGQYKEGIFNVKV